MLDLLLRPIRIQLRNECLVEPYDGERELHCMYSTYSVQVQYNFQLGPELGTRYLLRTDNQNLQAPSLGRGTVLHHRIPTMVKDGIRIMVGFSFVGNKLLLITCGGS